MNCAGTRIQSLLFFFFFLHYTEREICHVLIEGSRIKYIKKTWRNTTDADASTQRHKRLRFIVCTLNPSATQGTKLRFDSSRVLEHLFTGLKDFLHEKKTINLDGFTLFV